MTGILALDIATKTGWAWRSGPDAAVHHGVWRTRHPGFFGRFAEIMVASLIDTDPELVVCEATIKPKKTTIATLRILNGLAGVAQAMCDRRGIKCISVERGTYLKFFVGNGNASKPAVVQMCRAHGWQPKDHNAAEALALLACQAERTWGRQGYRSQTALEAAAR